MKTRIKVVHTADGNTHYITQYKLLGFWVKTRVYYKNHGRIESIAKYHNKFYSRELAEHNIDQFLENRAVVEKEKLSDKVVGTSYIKYPD
jgi:hypothetical protein